MINHNLVYIDIFIRVLLSMYMQNTSYYSEGTVIRKLSSKYDFVKVRIYLDQVHYYILSRFLVSRVLMAARIDASHAIRMALDLKKRLVDQCCLDLSQNELELEIFQLMREYGYGELTIRFYKMLSHWHHQRIPLVILISMNCMNNTMNDFDMISCLLSERLNMPCILKTSMIHELYCVMNNESFENVEYDQNSVMKLLQVDISKYISEGKSFLIEGPHIESSLLDCIASQLFKNNQDCHLGLMIPFLISPIDGSNDDRFVHIKSSSNASLTSCLDLIHDIILKRMMDHMSANVQ